MSDIDVLLTIATTFPFLSHSFSNSYLVTISFSAPPMPVLHILSGDFANNCICITFQTTIKSVSDRETQIICKRLEQIKLSGDAQLFPSRG
jgi:hypothetical protein